MISLAPKTIVSAALPARAISILENKNFFEKKFKGKKRIASAKSAFIPKTRVQVYFLEDSHWFKPLTNLVYKSKNGRVLADNAERYGYYSKAVLSTLPHLFWSPDIFICNGWQSAMVPGMYKKHFEGINDFYKKIKPSLVVPMHGEIRHLIGHKRVLAEKNIRAEIVRNGEIIEIDKDLTIKKDATAPQAAGKIHTDFEKGFIRAEVINFDDYITFNGEQGAKDAGKWRLEGKEYIVQDGDVIHFRFNV